MTRGRALLAGAAFLIGAASIGLPVGNSDIALQPASAQSPATSLTEPAAVGGPAQLRRLTESQYRATVADIFGPETPILGRFERGQREHGLLALGTSRAHVSTSSLEQYQISAQGIAAHALSEANRDRFLPCQPASDATFDRACALRFIEQTGMLLFRRPVTGDETSRYLKTAQGAHSTLGSFSKSIQFTLAGMLVAPEFLFRMEKPAPGRNELDAWSKASRLSFMLVDSSPDQELLRAAGAGELETDAGLVRQVDRLMASPHYARAVRSFFRDLLHFDDFADLTKDAEIFPAYTSKLMADAEEETLRTVVDLLVTQKGDYRDIFTTRDTFLTRPLGIVYRLPVPPRNDWHKTQFPEYSQRAGILSQVSLSALNAHPGISSPTLRGKFIRETFFCQLVPDPPANVDFSRFLGAEAVLPTARERLASHSESPACAGCHKLTDPIGLTLENFDGLGAFRTQEKGAPIDVSGNLNGIAIDGPVSLGRALHDDPEVPQCLAQKLYEAAVGYSDYSQEGFVVYLADRFRQGRYRLPDLMRAIATSRNFYAIASEKPGTMALSSLEKVDRP